MGWTIFGIILISLIIYMVYKNTKEPAPTYTPQAKEPAPAYDAPQPKFNSSSFDPGPMMMKRISQDWNITYTNFKGETSKRRITVKELFGTKYPKYVYAYCHLKKELRHFNIYNMETAHHARTGKEVPLTNHLMDWIYETSEQDVKAGR